jgi:hypothetical protein
MQEVSVMSYDFTSRTAFLVIHGVGPHESYQTCDDFARGFVEAFKKENKTDVMLKHLLKKRKGPVQSCISLCANGKEGCIDFYEYFWDVYMVHKVLPGEAWDLLVKASKTAKKHYDDIFKDPKAVAEIIDMDKLLESPFFRKRKRNKKKKGEIEFRPEGYLRLIGGFAIIIVKIIPYIPWVVNILKWLSKINVPVVSQVYGVLSSILKALAGLFQNQLEKFFAGDVVRYLDLDPRSKHYETRQKIIDGAIEDLCALMEDKYDRIIIAGHSLGSVIAYDAINRIILQLNAGVIKENLAEKITGLVIFGSPLDKIAFFFREYIPGEKNMQRKILADRHTFRTCSLLQPEEGIRDPDPFNQLQQVIWLNFWHYKDYISGRLDLYDLSKVPPKKVGTLKKDGTKDGNIRIADKRSFITAHGCYWGDLEGKGTGEMQEAIVKEFF